MKILKDVWQNNNSTSKFGIVCVLIGLFIMAIAIPTFFMFGESIQYRVFLVGTTFFIAGIFIWIFLLVISGKE